MIKKHFYIIANTQSFWCKPFRQQYAIFAIIQVKTKFHFTGNPERIIHANLYHEDYILVKIVSSLCITTCGNKKYFYLHENSNHTGIKTGIAGAE